MHVQYRAGRSIHGVCSGGWGIARVSGSLAQPPKAFRERRASIDRVPPRLGLSEIALKYENIFIIAVVYLRYHGQKPVRGSQWKMIVKT